MIYINYPYILDFKRGNNIQHQIHVLIKNSVLLRLKVVAVEVEPVLLV